ncbi:hypothetical protein K438DRAFT_1754489 [Mycena galopus ATCC 62051]|nr:hypothetical protein K438DRAFT_1754489 [Mycena galopus ATCC 62051]
MPVGLLTEIFDFAIRDNTHVFDVHRISRVCSDWWKVTHGTSRLWTRSLRVVLSGRNSDSWEQAYANGLKAWLTHSASLSIPISFIVRASDIRIPDEVLRIAPRWRSLQLPDKKNKTPISLDSLEELRLGILVDEDSQKYRDENSDEDSDETPGENNSGDQSIISFTAASRLRNLTINLYENLLTIFIPWAQLVDLTLDGDSSETTLDILAQCANLVRASVTTSRWPRPPQSRQDLIILSHLRTLHLPSFHSVGPLWTHLLAPTLQRFSWDYGGLTTATTLTGFQLRSPNITQLEFRLTHLTPDDLRAAILHAPFLTHLEVTDCYNCVDDTLLRALSY